MKAIVTGMLALMIGASCQRSRESEEAPSAKHYLAEIVRLRAHFTAVEQQLVRADTSHLSPEQRARRDARIRDLRRYAEGSVFPHNHQVAGMTPVFVDEHGTRCAMAHLIEASGDRALMESIARDRNLAYIRELVADRALLAWLDRNGLSAYEAATIQPAYPCGSIGGDCEERAVSPAQVVLSSSTIALGGLSIGLNVSPSARMRAATGLLGILSGGLGALIGGAYAFRDTRSDSSKLLGQVNLGVGVVAGLLGLQRLFTVTSDKSTKPAARAPRMWSLQPTYHRGGAGLNLGGRF